MKTITSVKTIRLPFDKPTILLLMMASFSVAWDIPDPSAGTAKSVPELQVALDARPTVRESLGVRLAQAAGEKAVKLEIGLSVTDAAGAPDSYRMRIRVLCVRFPPRPARRSRRKVWKARWCRSFPRRS